VKTTLNDISSPVIWREDSMTRFVVGDDRSQSTLFPERLDDYLGEDNPVRAIDVLVDELDLAKLGFDDVEPEATGRPAYHPATLLKIYVYGYLNRVQSSRRLERECQRNIELVWLTGRLMPDFKTIADFRKDNGEAIDGRRNWRSGGPLYLRKRASSGRLAMSEKCQSCASHLR
jgi:transposase